MTCTYVSTHQTIYEPLTKAVYVVVRACRIFRSCHHHIIPPYHTTQSKAQFDWLSSGNRDMVVFCKGYFSVVFTMCRHSELGARRSCRVGKKRCGKNKIVGEGERRELRDGGKNFMVILCVLRLVVVLSFFFFVCLLKVCFILFCTIFAWRGLLGHSFWIKITGCVFSGPPPREEKQSAEVRGKRLFLIMQNQRKQGLKIGSLGTAPGSLVGWLVGLRSRFRRLALLPYRQSVVQALRPSQYNIYIHICIQFFIYSGYSSLF